MYRVITLLLVAMYPLTSVADESVVYESFAGVEIGRVFLSQSQRELLDARRLLNPQQRDAGGEESAGVAPMLRKPASAGFIISRNGRSKVWKDGDFVDSGDNAARSMSFPGDIDITRHVEAATAADGIVSSDREPVDDDG